MPNPHPSLDAGADLSMDEAILTRSLKGRSMIAASLMMISGFRPDTFALAYQDDVWHESVGEILPTVAWTLDLKGVASDRPEGDMLLTERGNFAFRRDVSVLAPRWFQPNRTRMLPGQIVEVILNPYALYFSEQLTRDLVDVCNRLIQEYMPT